ncbi:MAG: DNA topoisomerase VI subunit B [Thaumarchaeota archaeon]|nr:DNA topoisomerase VI subunit B [Nitrososphaerota archaeon]
MVSAQVTFSEISPSEFFYRNRDLAGFSNPARALYMAARELVENSLDACETAGILPEVHVRITPLDPKGESADPRAYVLRVQDNGLGIDPKHAPNAFARVFYGSKFKLRQARGMFGMGGTMAILYGQITTNKPVKITTSVDGKKLHSFSMLIDIQENKPIILSHETVEGDGSTGTSVEVTLQGDFLRASQKIADYFRQTALVNPFANITYIDPQGKPFFYFRGTEAMPSPPQETKPHPHGIDVEAMRRLLRQANEKTLQKLLVANFHRVGERTAQKFLEFARLDPQRDPKSLDNEEVVKLVGAIHKFDEFLAPDASCLSPLGEEILKAGVQKELQPEFLAIELRPPSAYSGFPFVIEVALAYGGKVLQEGKKLFRFANRIPLLYDEANDVAWKVLNEEIDWKNYKIPEHAPIAIITHVCSTKVPYKTVGKEYLADRPELERELKNAVREVLRQLKGHLSRKGSMEMVKRKLNIYGKYLPLIARFSQELAQAKRPPRYRTLIGEQQTSEQAAETAEKAAKLEQPEVETIVPSEKKQESEEIEEKQSTLEEFAS